MCRGLFSRNSMTDGRPDLTIRRAVRCATTRAYRLGRRPVLIGATLFFGACMLATPLARTVGELTALRLVTGLGMGAIMPNAMALAGEYSPRRVRVTVMMVISCGFTVGAVLGGLVSVAGSSIGLGS